MRGGIAASAVRRERASERARERASERASKRENERARERASERERGREGGGAGGRGGEGLFKANAVKLQESERDRATEEEEECVFRTNLGRRRRVLLT